MSSITCSATFNHEIPAHTIERLSDSQLIEISQKLLSAHKSCLRKVAAGNYDLVDRLNQLMMECVAVYSIAAARDRSEVIDQVISSLQLLKESIRRCKASIPASEPTDNYPDANKSHAWFESRGLAYSKALQIAKPDPALFAGMRRKIGEDRRRACFIDKARMRKCGVALREKIEASTTLRCAPAQIIEVSSDSPKHHPAPVAVAPIKLDPSNADLRDVIDQLLDEFVDMPEDCEPDKITSQGSWWGQLFGTRA